MEEIHLHQSLRVTLLVVQDSQAGQGSMCKLVRRTCAAWTQARSRASCENYLGSTPESLRCDSSEPRLGRATSG
eukprot:6445779-Pyramimonas_sp.AAC.1